MRRAAILLACALLGAQEGPWLRDSLADRYPGPFPPEIPRFGLTQRTELRPGQATVLITESAPRWDRFQSFRLDVATELRKALMRPPATLHTIELADFMASDPSHPENLDLLRAVHALSRPAVPAYLKAPE